MTALPRVSAGGVELTLPPGWERLEKPEYTLVVAGPERVATATGDVFRASLNAIVVPVAADADIRTLGTEAIAAAHVIGDGAHVLAYDVWSRPHGVPGRRLELTYRQGPFALGVVQWIALGDGLATTLTATYTVGRPADRALAEALADSALLPGETHEEDR